MGRTLALFASLLALAACSTAPKPEAEQIADACKLLTDNKPWYKALRASAKEWGAPMGLQLAIINQESAFDAKAKAPRGERKWFGLVQGDRLSSAYGYSQALDTTWEMYKQQTGNAGADRHNFRDSTDFIGWYVNTTGKKASVAQYDYKAHYLAYHEGQSGYMQGTWRNKSWLVKAADRVASSAAHYEGQIENCRGLKREKFLGLF